MYSATRYFAPKYFAPRYFAGVGGIVYVPATLDEAIVAQIAANVTGLTAVYLQEVPARNPSTNLPPVQPYAIVNALNELPQWNTGGVDYPADATYQITVNAVDDTTGRALRDQAYQLFTPRKGSTALPVMVFSDGVLPGCGSLPGLKTQWKRSAKAAYGNGEWLYGFSVTFHVTRIM